MNFAGNNKHQRLDFQDLMLFRVHEILLVSSPYDAYILEEDGRLTEQILHEYLGMNFSYAPRLWHTQTAGQALKMIDKRKFDVIIIMLRIADMNAVSLAKKIKKIHPRKSLFLLAFDESELIIFREEEVQQYFDRVFIWSGNSNVFPAIIKQLEDRKNSPRDMNRGGVRAIIFIEDSPRFYSVILPMIYREIMYHTQQLVSKSFNHTQRLLHLRSRTKILFATNYESAKKYIDTYHENILGIVSDIRFPRKGTLDPDAGIHLTQYVREKEPHMPIILQSTNLGKKEWADKVNASFLNKRSDSLLHDIRNFVTNNFGFGNFIFRASDGTEISESKNLKDLKNQIKKIPADIMVHHASSNHFSNWIAARGEFKLADSLRPKQVTDFESPEELRKYLVQSINMALDEEKKLRVADFSQRDKSIVTNFTRLYGGSLGGKARGLGFMNKILRDSNLEEKFPGVLIQIPRIAVIGTDAFDQFMMENKLYDKVYKMETNEQLEADFLNASLPKSLNKSLKAFLNQVKYPLAVRSSSLLEDSQYQPLAGMYSTLMIQNADKASKKRLNQLSEAIKRIYASTFFKDPRSVTSTSGHRHTEEKMAILITELIGQFYGDRYYPTLSGIAQNVNYYPVSYADRNDGVSTIALGFGKTVVEGEKSLRFSPKYPAILPQFYSVRSAEENSQSTFYALDMDPSVNPLSGGEKSNLNKYSLDTAEKDGSLYWAGSVICSDDSIIRDSLRYEGKRIITFPSLLKWQVFPFPELIIEILKTGKKSLGTPVEIEFAVNLFRDEKPPEFCLLQIKPMVISNLDVKNNITIKSSDEVFIRSTGSLGDGHFNGIKNLIFVDPETFQPGKSRDIAKEIGHFNKNLSSDPYLLAGPGRWGSADPWLGIPVNWQDISNVKIMVEIGLKNFPVDHSFGSHFFQNVTSRRIGYFTISHKGKEDLFDMKWVRKLPLKEKGEFTSWYQLDVPLRISINGQNGLGVGLKPEVEETYIMDEQESPGI
jgi:hypothetical protein